MSPASADRPEVRLAVLLQALELQEEGLPLPDGALPVRRLARTTNRGWVIISRAAKELGLEPARLVAAAEECPIIEVADAEPPRLLGLFKRRPEPGARWMPAHRLAELMRADPVGVAEAARHHPVMVDRLLPLAPGIRGRAVPGKLRRPPRSQRYIPPTPSREALLNRVDRTLVERYAQEVTGQERRHRPPRTPLRFSDGHPGKDLSSAIRLLVTAQAEEVWGRMRDGTLAAWFREEAGETDLAAVVEAAAHTAGERNATSSEARALLLRYIRRTPVGADLERGLIEPMAEALRSRDGALVASTAQALLLLDSDMAAAELSSALFETEVAGRAHVISALGETGSPRAVAALERLARAATRRQDQQGALEALRVLASAGPASPVARSALERLGQA